MTEKKFFVNKRDSVNNIYLAALEKLKCVCGERERESSSRLSRQETDVDFHHSALQSTSLMLFFSSSPSVGPSKFGRATRGRKATPPLLFCIYSFPPLQVNGKKNRPLSTHTHTCVWAHEKQSNRYDSLQSILTAVNVVNKCQRTGNFEYWNEMGYPGCYRSLVVFFSPPYPCFQNSQRNPLTNRKKKCLVHLRGPSR